MNDYLKLAVALILIAFSALFVAAEYAIIRVRRTRIVELVERGAPGASAVLDSLNHLDRYLSGVQLGVTMASLGLGWVGEPTVSKVLFPLFRLIPFGEIQFKRDAASLIAFIAVTFVAVVFGELLPKWAAIQYTERAARMLAGPMSVFIRICYPLIWLLEKSAAALGKAFGIDPDQARAGETAHSEDEIMAIVEASEKSGALGANEAEMTEAVFKFGRTQAKTIMTPRVEIVLLFAQKTFDQNLEIARKSGYTRYPLAESDSDHILGMIHIKDLLALAAKPHPDIKTILRPISKAPETKQIDDLLKEMQRDRRQQAIVMDEYGGTSGLVTLEDILEELVGEIHDEHGRPADIETESDGGWLVMASTPIDDVTEKLDFELETPSEYESIGGYAVHQLGLGDSSPSVALGRYTVTVAQKDGIRIHRLRFHPASSKPA